MNFKNLLRRLKKKDKISSSRHWDFSSENASSRASETGDRALMGLIAFSNWFQVRAQPVLRRVDWKLIRTSGLILAMTFVLASSVSTFAAHSALNFAISARKTGKPSEGELMAMPKSPSDGGPSGSELQRFILSRNVFNSEGKLAPEVSANEGGLQKTKDLDFDAVPCVDQKLPVEVVGTIYTGDPLRSFVSVKDAKVSDNDTYKPGDVIIEHEDYEVHKVFRGHVEFRKGDEKICVALKGFEKEGSKDTASAALPTTGSVRPENVENLEFESALVQQEIGPGYANILNSAKLIPEVEPGTGTVAGFKIIAITPGSLFEKMKLQNGDVITEVNGVSLRDASQGFKLYQALQEEREITVNLSRQSEPMVRKVRVK
jgi:type II secretory pathway component PulC